MTEPLDLEAIEERLPSIRDYESLIAEVRRLKREVGERRERKVAMEVMTAEVVALEAQLALAERVVEMARLQHRLFDASCGICTALASYDKGKEDDIHAAEEAYKRGRGPMPYDKGKETPDAE